MHIKRRRGRMDHRENAERALAALRKGTEDYGDQIRYLYRESRKAGASLESLGTSKEEVSQLYVLGCATRARHWLNALRIGIGDPGPLSEVIRAELAKGNLSLSSIGTSEEELSSLQRKN